MGTNYIAPTWRQPENANKDRLSNYSITYDGSNDYITVSDNIFSGLETWSMAGFYNISRFDVDSALFGKYGNSPQQILLYWDNPLGWRLLWEGVSTDGQLVQLPTIQANEWHFIAVTYDGTTVKMYLDDQVYTNSVTTGAIISDTLPWQIGADGANAKDFNGKLSQLSFYDYAVGATEITYLRNGGNPLVISGAEPIAYYPLGDNSNPTANAGYPNIISDADAVFDFSTEDNIESPHIDMTGAMSISGWFKTTDTGYNMIYQEDEAVRSPNGPDRNWFFSTVNNVLRFAQFYDSGGSNVLNTSAITVNDGNWHHGVFVWDGTTNTDSMKIFVDGVLRGKLTASKTDRSNDDITGMIGGNNATYDMNGELSNIQIWNNNLTYGTASVLGDVATGEVAELYNNGLPLSELSEIPQNNNLLAWYKLNQSAVLTPGTPTNWTITKIGNPGYASGDDGGWAQNGILKSQDTNSSTISSGDYFQWNSPTIYTSGSNIVLSSSGGNAVGGGVGVEVIYQYNIDDSSWVTWHQHSDTSYGGGTYTVPSTSNLTVSNNIKIRVQLAGGPSNASEVTVSDINVNGGTSNYNESFDNTTRYGFFQSQETQPPATFSADHWEIPDNRSAYPQSFNFNGSNDYIDCGTSSSLKPTSAYSISGWFKLDDITVKRTIISNDNNNGYMCWVDASGKLWFYHFDTQWRSFPSNTTLVADTWYHFALTWDLSSTTGKMYINGEYDSQATNFGQVTYSSTPVYIGTYGPSQYFKGNISNISIFNTKLELTGAESVESLYNNGTPPDISSYSGLKAWYKLDNTDNYINSPENLTFTPDYWSIDPANITPGATEALNFSGGYQNLPGVYEGIEFNDTPLTDNRFIMSFWYNPTKATNDGSYIYHNYSGGTISIGFFTNSFNIYADPATVGSHMMRYYLPATRTGWHHLVMYMNQGSGSTVDLNNTDNLRIYVDGSELSVGLVVGDVSASVVRTEANRLGWTTGGNFEGFQWSNLSLLVGDNAVLSAIPTLYNGGTPGDISSLNPTWWYKLNSSDTSFPTSTPPTTADNVFTVTDSSGNANTTTGAFYYAKSLTTPSEVPSIQTVNVVANQGISSGMTEANLIDENVSVANGESDTLPGTALVQSDLTRKQPFSNYSITFDGTEDYFSINSSGALDTFYANPFSISLWFKYTSGTRVLFTKQETSSTSTRVVYIYTNAGNILWYGGGASPSATSSGGLSDGNWHHAVFVAESDTVARIYIDGVDDTDEIERDRIGTGSNTGSIILGTNYNKDNFFFNGEMSNTAIWTSALTPEEILDLYNNGVPTNLNTSFTPGPPEYWWPMDEDHTYFNGSVLIARDAVGSTDATGDNVIQENIVGNAPGSTANGVGSNLTITSLKGDMLNTSNNSYSINMADYADGVTNPADSGRSTNVP